MKAVFTKHISYIVLSMMVLGWFASCKPEKKGAMKTSIDLHEGWEFRQVKKDNWMKAAVPGNVHMDLLANKVIEDPFYRTNEKDQQWIDKEDWEYRTNFTVEKSTLQRENVALNFEGLDTYADVYVNDSLVLKADNMHVGWDVSVKKYLKEGKNSLRIYFTSPITKTIPLYDSLGYILPANNDQGDKRVSVFTRKAGYHYGWDWGPRFVTSGIWRPVHLQAWDNATIQNLQVNQTALTDDKASITGVFEILASKDSKAKVSFGGIDNGFKSVEKDVDLKKGINTVSVDIEIEKPEKWWPNGLGNAKLYQLAGALKIDGVVADSVKSRIGLRTVEVINEKDSIGESFYFKVNGVPVFMKGANYIPSDNFYNRVDKARYEMWLSAAVNSNMNMLRVWGGGIYENDMFYDMADEKGLLLWQDFMFGCSMYPGDSVTQRRITQEAAYNVKRLRNHPSLAFWCGNNEMDEAWHTWGWQKTWNLHGADSAKVWHDYEAIFHNILPEAVKKYDNRFYWSSSPKIGFRDLRSTKIGDMHYWGVWHEEKPFAEFKNYIGRFMSEFGFQSFPELRTIESYTIPSDWNIDSTVMKSHQRHPRGNQVIREYMQRDYKMPKDFKNFIYLQQVQQAQGMRMGLEAHRRKMPYNMGTLYWQLDDCWPVASWSGIDYYGRWKAMQYHVRKAYMQTLVSPTEDKGITSVWVVNDKLSDIAAKMKISILDFDGKSLMEKEMPITIPANSSKSYFSSKTTDLLKGMNKKNVVLVCSISEGDKLISRNELYFVAPKEMLLSPTKIESSVAATSEGFKITLKSDKLAKDVYINATAEGVYSNNYFDILPGETVEILFTPKEKGTKIADDLKIMTLVDAK